MSPVSALAIYTIIWWLVLFMILPFGAGKKIESVDVAEGHDAGAPTRPQMLKKILATTIVSLVVFAIFYFAYTGGYIDLRPE
jgi:predicted secreted protein